MNQEENKEKLKKILKEKDSWTRKEVQKFWETNPEKRILLSYNLRSHHAKKEKEEDKVIFSCLSPSLLHRFNPIEYI